MKYLTILFLLLATGCKDQASNPKPHGYPREYYPAKSYQVFDTNAPFSFMYPTYAVIKNYREVENVDRPYWYNINYLPFNATLHLSYQSFSNRDEFDHLFDDVRKLVYKHDIKAEEIEEIEIQNPATNTTGMIYEIQGNTATNLNFYVSDGQKHFLRGALYFNAKTQIDSILPMFNFLKEDVEKLIETTKWK